MDPKRIEDFSLCFFQPLSDFCLGNIKDILKEGQGCWILVEMYMTYRIMVDFLNWQNCPRFRSNAFLNDGNGRSENYTVDSRQLNRVNTSSNRTYEVS